jgi:hypothetical protein
MSHCLKSFLQLLLGVTLTLDVLGRRACINYRHHYVDKEVYIS